jgi:hypothetical protein
MSIQINLNPPARPSSFLLVRQSNFQPSSLSILLFSVGQTDLQPPVRQTNQLNYINNLLLFKEL